MVSVPRHGRGLLFATGVNMPSLPEGEPSTHEFLAEHHVLQDRLRVKVEPVLAKIDPINETVYHDLPKRKQPNQRRPNGLFRSG